MTNDAGSGIISVMELQQRHRNEHTSEHPVFVDLQVHSTASDGTATPSEVVAAAKEAGLAAIAITDHDTLGGLAEAKAAGLKHHVRVVSGVELSTHDEDEELHLLGLHIAIPEAIESALKALRDQRVDRAGQIVATLNRHGIPLRMEAVLDEAAGAAVGRPHIARAMVAAGYAGDFREVFDKWIGFGQPAYMPRDRFEIADGIALIQRAGGLAAWAHPSQLATRARVRRLSGYGLDGIEVLHPSHPPYLAQKIFDLTRGFDLLPSGGSDWHGVTEGPRRLGAQSVPLAWLHAQDARVAERLKKQGL